MLVESMVIAFDIETTGLNPYKCEIVLIGLKRSSRIKQWKLWEIGDELIMIKRFLKVFSRISDGETIVGYNNLKFDVPFIVTRLQCRGEMTPDVHTALYNSKWLDLYQYLGNNYRSLSLWLNRFGIRGRYEEIRGSEIPRLYEDGEYRKIEQHNRDDLNTSMRLFKRLKKEFPQILPYE